MFTDKQVTALVWYIAVVWTLVLLIGGTALPLTFFKPLSTVTAAVMLLLAVFERWLWRWRWFRGWLVNRPDLNGTWRVQLQSNWINPATSSRVGAIVGYLIVRQSFSRIGMRVLTAESSSRLRGAEITRDAPDGFNVDAVYVNEPKFGIRSRSPIHHGAITLAIRGTPPTILEGHYWTDRGTSGEMRADSRRKDTYDTFELAEAAFSQQAAASTGAASS